MNGKESPENKRFLKSIEITDPSGFKNIKVSFNVIEVSECPASYQPSTKRINKEIVGNIDFRELSVGSKFVEKFPVAQGIVIKRRKNFQSNGRCLRSCI